MGSFKIVSRLNTSARIIFRSYTYKPLYNLLVMQSTPLYPTLQSTLNVLRDDKYESDEDVKKLLQIYESAASKATHAVKKHPLIVLEGLDLSGKSTLTRVLASNIKAEACKTPPSVISQELRNAFDAKRELRSAFYSLGNYIAALEMLDILEKKPVVLDRYWHSTAAYALAGAVHNWKDFKLPPKGSDVYKWPADLLRPDRVLLLSVSEDERLRRHARRKMFTKEEKMLKNNHHFRQNVLLAYQYMTEPAVEIVDGSVSVEMVLRQLRSAVSDVVKTV